MMFTLSFPHNNGRFVAFSLNEGVGVSNALQAYRLIESFVNSHFGGWTEEEAWDCMFAIESVIRRYRHGNNWQSSDVNVGGRLVCMVFPGVEETVMEDILTGRFYVETAVEMADEGKQDKSGRSGNFGSHSIILHFRTGKIW